MIVRKKSVGQWAKQGEDYKNGDILTFEDSGNEEEGDYGVGLVFMCKFPSGDIKKLRVNQTSLNNLLDGGFPEETEQWKGKKVKAEVMKQNVVGKFTMVTYLFAPDAIMDGVTPDEQSGIESIPFN